MPATTRLSDLPEPQRRAVIDAAHEPTIRRGRLLVSTGRMWDCHVVNPKVADALIRRGLFEQLRGYGTREIRWTAAGAELAAGIVKAVEEAAALPDLTPGQVVRVYRAGAEPTRFVELVDGYKEWPALVGPSWEPFETGTIREELPRSREEDQRLYRITVVKDDQELFIDWTSRYWIRLTTEPAPGE